MIERDLDGPGECGVTGSGLPNQGWSGRACRAGPRALACSRVVGDELEEPAFGGEKDSP